jgi:phosphate uptake regulator
MTMELRKLQLTGGSTFVVSLPKRWVEANGLGQGKPVAISEMDDGTLLLEAHPGPAREMETSIDATRESEEHLLRRLIALYIKGYRTINVKGSKAQGGLTDSARRAVRRFTQMAMGPEVVEEGEAIIAVRDLLNPADLPPISAVKRMHLMARTMLTDSLQAVLSRDEARGKEIFGRDPDIDRLLWLVERQFSMLTRDPSLLKKMGADRDGALALLLVARYLERIGDHACRIGSSVPRAGGGAKMDKLVSRLGEVGARTVEHLNLSMDALYRKDLIIANRAIDSENESLEKHEDVIRAIAGLDGETAVVLGRINESVRRTGMYARDIAECAINLYADRT